MNQIGTLEKELQESRAECARLRTALEKIGPDDWRYFDIAQKALATSDGKEQLETVKEALIFLRQHKCSISYERLSEAFGIES